MIESRESRHRDERKKRAFRFIVEGIESILLQHAGGSNGNGTGNRGAQTTIETTL
jgi:hypothetical protein